MVTVIKFGCVCFFSVDNVIAILFSISFLAGELDFSCLFIIVIVIYYFYYYRRFFLLLLLLLFVNHPEIYFLTLVSLHRVESKKVTFSNYFCICIGGNMIFF